VPGWPVPPPVSRTSGRPSRWRLRATGRPTAARRRSR
jgi:hypothetical protein